VRFLQWMKVDRGVVESTLRSYGSYVGDLVRFLGDDPRAYTARGLRAFVGQRCRHYRRNSSRISAENRPDRTGARFRVSLPALRKGEIPAKPRA
jgi:hypothetical protein